MPNNLDTISPEAAALVALTVDMDATEFSNLLLIYVEMANGLDKPRAEIADTLYALISGENNYGDPDDRPEQIWQSLNALREDLNTLRNEWRDTFADDEDERGRWDKLKLTP